MVLPKHSTHLTIFFCILGDMKKIRYIKRKSQYMTEEEIFTWVGERQQELLDISPKIRMLLEDCLGQFVRIDGKHYIVTLGGEDIFNKGL